MKFRTTEEIEVPEKLIDQVIGQEEAVEIVRRAAVQRRHVFLMGPPGTGKSMLAQAMAELLPSSSLQDVLVYPNPTYPNNPQVVVVPAGEGKKIVEKERMDAMARMHNRMLLTFFPSLVLFLLATVMWQMGFFSDVIYAALLISSFLTLLAFSVGFQVRYRVEKYIPKLIVDNSSGKAPFVDATGAKAGSLLGDVLHDPFQSGGLETPPHQRVEPGAIHRAHGGVLFIDEIATLDYSVQQELLTAMQDKKYPIKGQSERSAGAMVRTEPVPCDFVLVAAGNWEDLAKMHPALRSRIRGYGYEVKLRDAMPDTPENREKIARFVAQEVKKDGKIPHFTREAVEVIIREARKRAGKKNSLTLKLRELGGLVRAAGDVAVARGHRYVELEDVEEALKRFKTLEQQEAEDIVKKARDYSVVITKGRKVGRVNGLAVIGGSDAGLVIPVEAEVVPSSSRSEGRVIATGGLGEIAKEAVLNVSAVVKRRTGRDLRDYDIHIQFLQAHGVEGDSASISVAVAVISALENIPVDQSYAMTGSLSVRGEVLPVGGINAKIEAAAEAGIEKVIIPEGNREDISLPDSVLKKVKVIPVSTIEEVLDLVLQPT